MFDLKKYLLQFYHISANEIYAMGLGLLYFSLVLLLMMQWKLKLCKLALSLCLEIQF